MKLVFALAPLVLSLGAVLQCGPRQPLSPADEQAIVVAEDACQELADESDEAWVKLLCQIGGGIARYVFVPRPQWESVKAAHLKTTSWRAARAARASDGGTP